MPDWVDPVAHYMIHVGLPATLRIAALAVVGSVSVGILLVVGQSTKWPLWLFWFALALALAAAAQYVIKARREVAG